MAARAWTSAEIDMLRRNAHLGLEACAQLLDRSPASVRTAAARHRISLRRRGEHRGLVLGQPRSQSWAGQAAASAGAVTRGTLAAIRDAILSGDVDAGELERRIRGLIAGQPARTCPSCGARPQTRPATGLCDPCHLRHLAAAHRDAQATRLAKRELWRERQASSRKTRARRDRGDDDAVADR